MSPAGTVAESLQHTCMDTCSLSSLDASRLCLGSQWSCGYYGAKPALIHSAGPIKLRKHSPNSQLTISFEIKNSLSTCWVMKTHYTGSCLVFIHYFYCKHIEIMKFFVFSAWKGWDTLHCSETALFVDALLSYLHKWFLKTIFKSSEWYPDT